MITISESIINEIEQGTLHIINHGGYYEVLAYDDFTRKWGEWFKANTMQDLMVKYLQSNVFHSGALYNVDDMHIQSIEVLTYLSNNYQPNVE